MEFNLKLPNHLPSTFPHISLTSLQPSTLFGHKHASIAPPRRKLMFSSGYITRNPASFPSTRHCHRYFLLKEARGTQLKTQTSVKPVNEELVEDKSKDLPVSGDSIRQRFLQFYASRGHKVLPSASLVPEDPTVLLTIAGMLQFKSVFLGKERLQYSVTDWSFFQQQNLGSRCSVLKITL
uniref:Alanyl-tRNA synthetase class IIc N-terminal domain-containing protein n=1 Tax=Cucumis sativus TaxID=3659 RepID=A0A0A0KAG1_CUCSA